MEILTKLASDAAATETHWLRQLRLHTKELVCSGCDRAHRQQALGFDLTKKGIENVLRIVKIVVEKKLVVLVVRVECLRH